METGIIGTLIIGLIVGIVAKLIMPGKDPGGCIITTLLGIAGAFVGNFVARAFGVYNPDGWVHFAFAVLGALIILAIYRLIVGKKSDSERSGDD